MRRRARALHLMAVLVIGLLAAGTAPAAAAGHEQISGSGSSWATNAINVWISAVSQDGLKVVFTSGGSGIGRKDFANSTTDYAVSDIGYLGKDPQTGEVDLPCKLGTSTDCRGYAYLPIVGGGTAFPYHLTIGGKKVVNLRLSGLTLAKIFTGGITNWNDPAITKDNNGRKFPGLPIIPIVHSEPSGSSAQFSAYLDKMFPSIWRPFNHGKSGEAEYYPRGSHMIAQNGSDNVMNYVASAAANGAIGYDEYSYPLLNKVAVAKIENSAGYFTLPTQFNVAVALQKAIINPHKDSPDYLLQDLHNVYTFGDKRSYPLSSYSYAIIPTSKSDSRMNSNKRQTLADFLSYSICEGQAPIGPVGYSALPLNLVQAGFEQIGKLKAADPKVDLTNRAVTSCNNPTFTPGNLAHNHLADIAPQPPACDQSGQGPCTGAGDAGTQFVKPGGTVTPDATAASGSGGSGPASGPTGKTGTVTNPTAAAPGAKTSTTVNPDTGQPVAAPAGNEAVDVAGQPTELADYRQQNLTNVLAPLAILLLFAALFGPPVVYLRLIRPRGRQG